MTAPPNNLTIGPMQPGNWVDVRAIYAEGIATGNATFEETPPEWNRWNQGHLACCRLIARLNNEVVAWAALSPVSGRRVYAGVAEVSIYVSQKVRGKGIGLKLLKALVGASEQEGIWTLQAGIFPENSASIELHKRSGFRIVGIRERLGYMHGIWRDVVLMERRSSQVGIA